MMINSTVLPFDITGLVKSKAWQKATPEQRKKFISAGVAFTSMINYYAKKYRANKTLKGEFIACVLWDFYYDLFENQLREGAFDFELDAAYPRVDEKEPIDNFSERLLDEAIHSKKWIKKLKRAYRENENEIRQKAYSADLNMIDKDLINDFSVEYRDYLY